jgi:dienelactone hydrolase
MTALGERVEVEFNSNGVACRGWLYRPAADATGGVSATGTPCVVMAHGLGATKYARLANYAEYFAAAGLAVLVFDYRHFGDSDGEPRELIDIKRQHEDYQAAIAYARSLAGIDPDRIGLWGSSFSGGHVVWVAARDPRIAAVVAQIPHTSGPAGVLATGPKRIAYFTYAALRDQIGSLLGRDPFYLPIVGPPGAMAALTTDQADELYRNMYPEGYDFPNRAAARMGLWLASWPTAHLGPRFSPMRVDISTPTSATSSKASPPPRPTFYAAT